MKAQTASLNLCRGTAYVGLGVFALTVSACDTEQYRLGGRYDLPTELGGASSTAQPPDIAPVGGHGNLPDGTDTSEPQVSTGGGLGGFGSASSAGGGSTFGGGAGADEQMNVGGDSGIGEGGATTILKLPSPLCDDGNPCTADSFIEGACQHPALDDGTPCDDDDLCTLGDRCQGGACQPGARQSGVGKLLGALETYGTGNAVSLAGDGFVFVDGQRLTFTGAASDGLQTGVRADIPGLPALPLGTDLGNALLAFVEQTGSTTFGAGTPPSVKLVYFGDGISASGSISLTPYKDQALYPYVSGMDGVGKNLFVCSNVDLVAPLTGFVHWIDVSQPDAPVMRVQHTLAGGCGSVAVSDDGSRLYVNTPTGVRWAELAQWDGGNTLPFKEAPLVAENSGLDVRGNRLLTRTSSRLRLFDETLHTELASISRDRIDAAALTDSAIYVEGNRIVGTSSELFAALYDFNGLLIEERTLAKLPYISSYPYSKKAVASANYVVHSTTHQVFRVTQAGFQTVNAPYIGSLNQIYPGEKIRARGRYSAHRIDVSDPLKPVIEAGGSHQDPLLGIKLDESLSPVALVGEESPVSSSFVSVSGVDVPVSSGQAPTTVVERVTTDTLGRYVPAGVLNLPPGEAGLLVSGDYLYRSAFDAGTTPKLVFQRWLLKDLRDGVATPSLDLELDESDGMLFYLGFDVDPKARVAAVMSGILESGSSEITTKLRWINLADQPPSISEVPLTEDSFTALRVSGNALAYSSNGSVVFRDRGSDMQTRIAATAGSVLAFDGTTAYYSKLGGLGAIRRYSALEAGVVLDVPLNDTPTSLVANDHALVSGSRTHLFTLAPACLRAE